MKLKKNIPIYEIGQEITIIDNLILGSAGEYGAYIPADMQKLQGITFTIRNISDTHSNPSKTCYYLDTNIDGILRTWHYPASIFKESYENLEEDITEPYIGMYLCHRYNLNGESYLMRIYSLVDCDNDDSPLYFRTSYVSGKRNLKTLDSDLKREETRGMNNLSCRHTKSIKDGRVFFGDDLYIPTNEELMERWGVTNRIIKKEEPLKEGMLPIPDLFKYSKYPIKYIRGIKSNGNSFNNYAFRISRELYVEYIGGRTKSIKLENLFKSSSIDLKDYNDIIVNWGNVKIKSYEESSRLFGHKTRKKAMFEASNTNPKKPDVKYPVQWKVTKVIFNYEKEGKYYHVFEIYDGNLNLKFLMDDLELILPNVNNYIEPKDRTIRVESDCKVIKDKLLPINKGSKVKVIKMFNRHTPLKGIKSFDRNTVCVVMDSNNKQFECKVKQLKKI